jgi:hypothetical protein
MPSRAPIARWICRFSHLGSARQGCRSADVFDIHFYSPLMAFAMDATLGVSASRPDQRCRPGGKDCVYGAAGDSGLAQEPGQARRPGAHGLVVLIERNRRDSGAIGIIPNAGPRRYLNEGMRLQAFTRMYMARACFCFAMQNCFCGSADQQISRATLAAPPGCHDVKRSGRKMVDPVVRRASRSACARAASASGQRWRTLVLTLPDSTTPNNSAAMVSRSPRLAM